MWGKSLLGDPRGCSVLRTNQINPRGHRAPGAFREREMNHPTSCQGRDRYPRCKEAGSRLQSETARSSAPPPDCSLPLGPCPTALDLFPVCSMVGAAGGDALLNFRESREQSQSPLGKITHSSCWRTGSRVSWCLC